MASKAKGARAKVLVLALVFFGYSTYSQKPLYTFYREIPFWLRFPDQVRFLRKVHQIVKIPVPRGSKKSLATSVHFHTMSDTHDWVETNRSRFITVGFILNDLFLSFSDCI